MITTNMGETKITGSISGIMADYSMITQSVIECLSNKTQLSDDEAKEVIKTAFNIGFYSGDEIQTVTDSLRNLVSIVFWEKGEK